MSEHIPTVRVSVPKIDLPVPHTQYGTLKPAAQALFRLLYRLGRDVLEARGQSPQASQVVFHMSAELIAAHLQMGRATMYRHLPALQAAGLLACKGHVSTVKGQSRQDGTLFAVSLRAGYVPRLRREDYKHSWRDLEADIASGVRTAWSVLQGVRQSKTKHAEKVEYLQLLTWAVTPGTSSTPVKSDCLTDSGSTLGAYVYSLDLLSETHPKQRGEVLDRYARAMSRHYLDASNLNFWRWMLWRALDGEARGEGMLYQLRNALTRLAADLVEWDGLKRPGALLVARLREAGIWDALKQSQQVHPLPGTTA